MQQEIFDHLKEYSRREESQREDTTRLMLIEANNSRMSYQSDAITTQAANSVNQRHSPQNALGNSKVASSKKMSLMEIGLQQ